MAKTLVDQAVAEFCGVLWAELKAEKHRKKLSGLVVQLTETEVGEYVARTGKEE